VREQGGTDWWRLIKLLAGVAISGAVGYYFQPMVAHNADAGEHRRDDLLDSRWISHIAVITLIADPVLRGARDWQELQLMKATVQRKLFRQKLLFFLNLITLGVALATFLVPDSMAEVQRWLEVGFLGLATFVFLASFELPGSLCDFRWSVTRPRWTPPSQRC
jgi:hypothetical protein